jgi:CubicO group peptidase (beta-lactamase class C family)
MRRFLILHVRHGQVADFKSFGQQTPDKPMALDSLFRIYSMSKPITGVAMMQLYEQGKWQLDDPITKYAPGAREPEGADVGQGRQGRDGRRRQAGSWRRRRSRRRCGS